MSQPIKIDPSKTLIPRGKIKEFRELLNRENALVMDRENARQANDPARIASKHRNGRYRQVKRLYGDYLYRQDRDKFMADIREWLREAC